MAGSPVAASAEAPKIPLFDLALSEEDLEAVEEALRAGVAILGPRTEAFERAFAEHLGVRNTVAVSSCTAALHLAYLAAGVGPGDEVVVPTYTFAATANAVLYCGATPVFADSIGVENPCVDPADVERRLTSRTKAVAVVHFAGYPAPVEELRALCAARGLALIEDAAHAPSAEAGGRKLGTFGLAGAFSFFSNKVLPVGEGGLVATDDDDLAARVRALRAPGAAGFGCVLDEAHAALALVRLRHVEAEIELRRAATRRYRERLGDLDGVVLPFGDGDVSRSSCYVMPIMVDPGERDRLRDALRAEGIQTSLLYPPIHLFSAYRRRVPHLSLPGAELASRSEVTIPLYPHIAEEELERVADAIERALAR